MRVSGAVKAIRKDILNDPYMEIWTTNRFESVHASFDDTGALSQLKPGDRVVVRCIGNNVIMGSPMLRSCVLE
ncbi:MAG: hypothetical protein E6J90_02430 [Deltaproteobacteria bacterium]|nr:MAG: hypothetical protein E6J91_13630 [Deltaproteobacteria bacterium]TMQ27521.1 MAG: hypothetical protein E6J90_02430 [Deltaproteobacteria bacterium]